VIGGREEPISVCVPGELLDLPFEVSAGSLTELGVIVRDGAGFDFIIWVRSSMFNVPGGLVLCKTLLFSCLLQQWGANVK
jgi:hypothetical protein